MTLLPASARAAIKMLRAPSQFYLWDVIRRNTQPYGPLHLARFEVAWRRPSQILNELRRARLRAVDIMAVAPMFGNAPELLERLRADPRARATALR